MSTTVLVNGCFDVLHIGHTRLLCEATNYGDVLIVALNSDASVRRLKGDGRPINPESQRKEMLLALKWVDEVLIFGEDTPLHLIRSMKPDVFVKGELHAKNADLEIAAVKLYGGEIVLLPEIEEISTTKTIGRAKRCPVPS